MNSQPSSSIAPPAHEAPSTSEPPRRRRHRWIWALVLLAFGLLFYWVFSYSKKSQQAAMGGGGGGRRGVIPGMAIPVVPATAKAGSLGVYFEAIGTVTPVYTVSLTAQVTGVITDVHYREGQYVKKGDPLVDIDPRPYAAQLAQAQGALQRDQNLLDEAQMDLTRYQTAWAKNAIPRQTLEDQEKLVLQDQGTVKTDQGNVEYAAVQLGYCHIVSPIDGRVGLRLVDPGNLVTANSTTSLVVVTQMQPITVIFTLAEDNLDQVLQQMRLGHTLSVEAWNRDRSIKLGSGRLMTVDNLIDTTTGTVKLRAQFPNSDGLLFPNQFVNSRLLVKTLTSQIMVPASAIQHNGDIAYVYLIQPGPGNPRAASPQSPNQGNRSGAGERGAGPSGNPGGEKAKYHVVMQNVKTGVTDNGWTAVEGIPAGTTVADSSFDKLEDQADVSLSKIGIPTASSTISGENSAP
ncbi:MAG: efflux RND transporter periplasmic adaptor subunit [Acidobacteriota bacterium]